MAKTAAEPPGRSGSQFFVVTAADAGLPPHYALLGKVELGQDVVDRIASARRPGERRHGHAARDRGDPEDHGERGLGDGADRGRRAAPRISSFAGTGGRTYRLGDYRGRWLVLAFYPGRLHAGVHPAVLLLPRRGRPTGRARRRGARRLPAIARLPRALPRQVRAHGAAARRPRADHDPRLRRARPRRARPPLDLHRRPRGDRALPPRRPAGAPLQGRRGAEASRCSGRGPRRRPEPASRRSWRAPSSRPSSRSDGRAAGSPASRSGRPADRAPARDHRHPPLRRPRLQGPGSARAIGRSPTTPAATASPIPPPPDGGYSYARAGGRPGGGARRRGGRPAAGARRPLDGGAHGASPTRSRTASGSPDWW